jgi:hypothetical protein
MSVLSLCIEHFDFAVFILKKRIPCRFEMAPTEMYILELEESLQSATLLARRRHVCGSTVEASIRSDGLTESEALNNPLGPIYTSITCCTEKHCNNIAGGMKKNQLNPINFT